MVDSRASLEEESDGLGGADRTTFLGRMDEKSETDCTQQGGLAGWVQDDPHDWQVVSVHLAGSTSLLLRAPRANPSFRPDSVPSSGPRSRNPAPKGKT